ncbi:TPA: hypothetical protein CPT79_09135 [Candidatus Gastranaerophilales bacterium HUM_6]|nr:MAG TPA: hypothetical protein CPT79_09135 [Candidatus Gastranaerophilales bacterium HUM_6]DAA94996.1 MAG TPA: hypothetical protein CPT93_01770 [Candidatus Gastranaerophilales bacterium HUM_7]DAB00394.1 MAG TPA: hypothetical protein CPT84_08605 [Candidatus Gastranaerophilales bacterium HUM_12]DAB08549.1 MAG TPA: hypothetical protein CPT78_01500 [Candidatus Gastranaerophilales bacterium HUM_14]
MAKFLFIDFEKCVISTCLKHSQLSDLASLGVKPYVKFHHLKQLEQLKSEPKGSFLMLSIHLSFEKIMADLNSANPTSAISFLASFTRLNNLIV